MIETLISLAISEIISKRPDIIPFFIRKRSKFEGWLKFELALYLESVLKYEQVEIEPKNDNDKSRCDISFVFKKVHYKLELKTCNTNWKIPGVSSSAKNITKNISSIVKDVKKLNCSNGIVAFVMFPIPLQSEKWKVYVDRISSHTAIILDETHYHLLPIAHDTQNKCQVLICCFRSKVFIE